MSRLGVDAIVGDRVEDLAQLTLVLGPVSLDTYYAFQEDERKALLDAVLYLIAPCHQRYRVAWSIGDRAKAPALGVEERNSRLGLNSYLGASPA
jgi:predicted component of type VI protein secretion system